MNVLLILGYGYTAQYFARDLLAQGWRVLGTTRSPDKANVMQSEGVEPVLWPGDDLGPALSVATHILASGAPGPEGDPFLRAEAAAIRAASAQWVGYLSTTGVYGDHKGGWVDETTPLAPGTLRGRQRVLAEGQWQALGLPLHIFRLAAIYGPGRGPFSKVRGGNARRVIKPGQVFSRIHVEDIAQTLRASICRPSSGAIYNVCDDDPVPPQDVLMLAAELLGVPAPPEVPFEQAEMNAMARSFYAENKRVSNRLIKDVLGVRLAYPSYRTGLPALLKAASDTRGGKSVS